MIVIIIKYDNDKPDIRLGIGSINAMRDYIYYLRSKGINLSYNDIVFREEEYNLFFSWFSKKIDPFKLMDYNDGNYSITLDQDYYLKDIKINDTGNYYEMDGHEYENLFKKYIKDDLPYLLGDLDFDSESGMFCVYCHNEQLAQELVYNLAKLYKDSNRMQQYADKLQSFQIEEANDEIMKLLSFNRFMLPEDVLTYQILLEYSKVFAVKPKFITADEINVVRDFAREYLNKHHKMPSEMDKDIRGFIKKRILIDTRYSEYEKIKNQLINDIRDEFDSYGEFSIYGYLNDNRLEYIVKDDNNVSYRYDEDNRQLVPLKTLKMKVGFIEKVDLSIKMFI